MRPVWSNNWQNPCLQPRKLDTRTTSSVSSSYIQPLLLPKPAEPNTKLWTLIINSERRLKQQFLSLYRTLLASVVFFICMAMVHTGYKHFQFYHISPNRLGFVALILVVVAKAKVMHRPLDSKSHWISVHSY